MPTAVEQIILTAIPAGVAASAEVSVSIHLAPTLNGGTSGFLKDFPDFVNWPQTLMTQKQNGVELQLTFTGSGGTFQQSVAIPTTDASPDLNLNTALWTALFGDGSTVQYSARDSGEPYNKVPVVSYPSDQVAAFLQTTYTNLITGSPNAYPSLQTLQGAYGGIGFAGTSDELTRLNSIWNELANQRLSTITVTGAPQSPPYANDWTGVNAATALAALRFYHMPASRLVTPPAPTVPTVDFHRALTFINQHFTLQRALGLVLDVSVSQRVVTDAAGAGSTVYVSAAFVSPVGAGSGGFTPSTGVTYTPVNPRVEADYTAGAPGTGVFRAHAATSQIVGGQLTLGDTSSFAVYPIDVDGGGLKTAQFADNLVLAQNPQSADGNSGAGPAPDAPTGYAPPSLRSAGLTVAAVNRGLQFVSRLQRGATLLSGAAATPPTVPDLMAEDLITGYVLDVYDAPGKSWNSTALRDVTYTAGAITLTDTDEPGLDSPPRSQTSPTNASQQQLNLPANIIRWTGWSNAAPRPGQPLAADGTSTVETGGPGSGPFDQLTITAVPHPGSLPRLRFGTEYALRARTVDIANNVIPLADGAGLGDAESRVTPLAVYGRHEPIGSPDIYTFNNPLPGESLKHLVIRDIDAAPNSVRALAPNRVAELFAELHGEFDIASGGGTGLNPNAYSTIVARESQRYQFATAQTPSGTPLWQAITLTSPVPFLPDPLARGATLYVTNGPLSGNSYQFDFSPASGQGWPLYQPYGVLLTAAASRSVTTDATKRQITFALSPADVVPLQLSSYVDEGDLPTLGIYQWILDFYKGAVPASFSSAAVGGLTWALTPFTLLELIYAVRQPLLIPTFNPISPTKELGWTYAQLFGDVTYSPKSTAHIELLATWGEPVDNGPGSGTPQGPGSSDTTLSPRQSTVFTIASSLDQVVSETTRFSGRHEFFDTKYRAVTYVGQATSAFTEHYPGQATITVPAVGTPTAAITLPGQGNLGLEPGSVVVSAGTTIYQENTAFTVNGAAATLTFEAAPTGPAPGTSVNVDFLPAVSVESAPTTLQILSSARPLSAAIEFVVPIFKWGDIRTLGARKLSERGPAALRVFLSRPWWSSGLGELLGVTTLPVPSRTNSVLANFGGTIPSASAPYVSDWGVDPVFKGKDLPTPHPYPTTFPARVATANGLSLDETPNLKVSVAGHDVFYDSVRDLWYADIAVNFGKAYTPMLRLALARYQPNSISGVELSRVVQADVMSLDPGRAVVVVRKSPKLVESVTLAGYSYSRDADVDDTAPGIATIVVERRVPSIHDETVGWEPVGKPIQMIATHSGDLTVWRARDIKIPSGGKHRLWLGQYEVIPRDNRSNAIYVAYFPSDGLRLLYQDIIPL